MRLLSAALAFFLLTATTVQASEFERLMVALKMDEAVDILTEEGGSSALDLEESMFPGMGGPTWVQDVERIYDAAPRKVQLREEMASMLSETDLEPLLTFFESEMGQRIMTLEISARRAFMDPTMEDVATETFADAEETRPVLHAQVLDFTEINGLIDANVEGAFRTNAAFAIGAHEAGAFAEMSVETLIAEMWSGDELVKADVTSWLYAFQMTAYAPLASEELAGYIAISKTEEGQALNAAIMGGFDTMFTDMSYELGFAAGRFMSQQEL